MLRICEHLHLERQQPLAVARGHASPAVHFIQISLKFKRNGMNTLIHRSFWHALDHGMRQGRVRELRASRMNMMCRPLVT